MGNFLWVKTKRREELLEKVTKIPEMGKRNMSDILEMALEEFVKKHGDSTNPQTRMSMFKSEGILAVPNVYEATDNPEMWKNFFKNMKNMEEYKEFDTALNAILLQHNQKNKEFL